VSGALVAVVAVAVMVAITGYLVGAMLYSIRQEKKSENLRKTWKNFALSISFCALFLISWAAQGITQWDEYKKEQQAHKEPVEMVEFVNEFSRSTLENWQSEFLQLFSFVVLSAIFIHHGSAESKDSDDRIENTLRRIEQKLDGKT
jgi:NADH:ubiquinone oxidoreductase subunit 6 (subunit J)